MSRARVTFLVAGIARGGPVRRAAHDERQAGPGQGRQLVDGLPQLPDRAPPLPLHAAGVPQPRARPTVFSLCPRPGTKQQAWNLKFTGLTQNLGQL